MSSQSRGTSPVAPVRCAQRDGSVGSQGCARRPSRAPVRAAVHGVALAALSAWGCAGGDGLTVTVTSGALLQPVAGAEVLLGTGTETRQAGFTDGAGTIVLNRLDGAAPVVSVRHPDFVTQVWAGIRQDAVGLVLRPLAPTTQTLQASVSLEPPASGVTRSLHVVASFPRTLERLTQLTAAAQGSCEWQGLEPCTVQLSAPSDSLHLLAVVSETQASSGAVAVTHVGLLENFADSSENGQVLVPLLDETELGTLRVDTSDTAEVVGLPGLNINGNLLFYPELPNVTEFPVPAASDDAPGLWIVATRSLGEDAWTRSFTTELAVPGAGNETVHVPDAVPMALEDLDMPDPGVVSLSNETPLTWATLLTSDRGEIDLVMLDASRYELPLLLGEDLERVSARQLGLNTDLPTVGDPRVLATELVSVASENISF